MKIILQIGIVLGICFLGEGMAMLLPFPFPASVISMILLFLLLCTGILKKGQVKEFGNFLLRNMAFFFVPAGVGIIAKYDALKGNIFPLFVICFLSTVITFAATAFTVKGVIKLQTRKHKKGGESE